MSLTEPHLRSLRAHAGGMLVVWSLILLAVAFWFVRDESSQELAIVQREAETIFQRDLLYRDWVSRHGGVYVPETDELQPNPFLAHLPERDVVTPSGRRLTLINPDYMTRSISFAGKEQATRGHVVSLNPIRKENAPDTWERVGLLRFREGATEQSALVEIEGRQFFRYMRPLRVNASCLSCHATHGYRVGEVHGALSLTLPVSEALQIRQHHIKSSLYGFTLVWFLGSAGILFSGFRLHRQMEQSQRQALELCRAQQDIEFLTNFDTVTALPNRERFSATMHQALEKAATRQTGLAVGVVGVDHFKKLKNTFGHQIGEELLKTVVQRIDATREKHDQLATLSEGRLLVLLPLPDTNDRIAAFVQRIQDQFAKPVQVEGQEFFVTVTCGFACYPIDGNDEKSLISAADATFSRAKGLGRNSFLRYSQQLKARALEQITLENTLWRALERDELEIFYQPQVEANSGKIVGAEALLRWRSAEFGMVSPSEFIPLAEETGIIFTIGQWVLEQACCEAARWQREFGESLTISVNVSPRQVQQTDLVAVVERALQLSGLEPSALVLEITEGSIVEDVERAVELITELRRRNVRIAIDDFGTGYSSLSYLRHFPVDLVKIDKSFVFDIHQKDNNVIVGSIVTMAKRMDLEIVAEGVETEAQRDFLLALGCRTMQGFYYSRPLDGRHFSELLNALQAGSGDYYLWWQMPVGTEIV